MRSELLIGVGDGLFAFAKLSAVTLTALWDANLMFEFNQIMSTAGADEAHGWLLDMGFQGLLPLTAHDVGSNDMSNWLIGKVHIGSCFDEIDQRGSLNLGGHLVG